MSAVVVGLSAIAFVVLLVMLFDRGDADTEPAFDAAVRVPAAPSPEEPASLKSARWLIVNASTAGGLHFRVRPVFIELTEARLRGSHGMDLAHPAAPAMLGEALWAIVRPDARPPDNRMAPGLSPSMLRPILDRLETL